jgi:hypothetical protein
MNRLCFLPLLVFAALCSCAGYSITPVAPGSDWSSAGEGYRIYEPKPYLRVSVTQTEKGPAYSADLTYLPNLARPYRIRTWSCLSKAEFQFAFQNGWMLTSVNSKLDTAEVPKAIVDMVKGIATAQTSTQQSFVVHFYEVKVCKDSIEVAESPSFTIKVPSSSSEQK